MSITKKAESAQYHVAAIIRDQEKQELHLLQARAQLRKDDNESRLAIEGLQNALEGIKQLVKSANTIIAANNPAKETE